MIDDLEQWAISIPELETRPLALAIMRENLRLRRWVERIHHELMGLATRLVAFPIAAQCLTLVWKDRSAEFHDHWNHVLPNPVFAQCHGVIRNVFLNALVRATGKRVPFRECDVERRLPSTIRERLLIAGKAMS